MGAESCSRGVSQWSGFGWGSTVLTKSLSSGKPLWGSRVQFLLGDEMAGVLVLGEGVGDLGLARQVDKASLVLAGVWVCVQVPEMVPYGQTAGVCVRSAIRERSQRGCGPRPRPGLHSGRRARRGSGQGRRGPWRASAGRGWGRAGAGAGRGRRVGPSGGAAPSPASRRAGGAEAAGSGPPCRCCPWRWPPCGSTRREQR